MITNRTIKREIRSCIQQIEQWDNIDNIDIKHRYVNELETLVELLEVDNCGSVGGFDKGQQRHARHKPDLIDRAKWVLAK